MIARLATAGIVAAAAFAVAGCGGIGNAQSTLRTAIEAKKPTLDTCYEDALVRDETLRGDMTLFVHVTEEGGSVSQVEIVESTIDDAQLTQCVESTLIGTQITPAPKANLKVEYNLQFSPQPAT